MLTTDGTFSFAVMNYAQIGLEEDEFRGKGHVGAHSYITDRSYKHPNSQRPAIVHIADETGNTGQLGQWVFRTDDLNATATTTTGTPTGVQQPNYVSCQFVYIGILVSTIIASRSISLIVLIYYFTT